MSIECNNRAVDIDPFFPSREKVGKYGKETTTKLDRRGSSFDYKYYFAITGVYEKDFRADRRRLHALSSEPPPRVIPYIGVRRNPMNKGGGE
jgi:hypothetical protein